MQDKRTLVPLAQRPARLAGLDAATGSLVRPGASGRPVVLVWGMHQPDDKILPLLFVSTTARELRASGVGLVAPCLTYMRQDRRFQPGAVRSRPKEGAGYGSVFR